MFIMDPGSRVLIFTHPGSRIADFGFRIPDPKTVTKERGENTFFCQTFFCSHKFHKIVNYFIFEMLKKNIWANFRRTIELFIQKIVTKLSQMWVWDPIRDSEKNHSGSRIPDPGVKKAPDPGSRLRIHNTA
jgi:hypothetical protein